MASGDLLATDEKEVWVGSEREKDSVRGLSDRENIAAKYQPSFASTGPANPGEAFDTMLGSKRLTLIQKNSQSNQRNRDDPEDNVFTALFFVSHRRQYTTPEIAVQVACSFPGTRGFTALIPPKRYPLVYTP